MWLERKRWRTERLWHWPLLFLLFAGWPRPANAQSVPHALTNCEQKAATLFNPTALAGSELAHACDSLLLMLQAASVALMVAAMIAKMRKDHEQMEGVASVMLKVAFIATIPFWRTFALQTADQISEAIGYVPSSSHGASSPLMSEMWKLAAQWTPANSPYLDALQAQNADNLPKSGTEQAWATEGWNWARGLGTTTADNYAALWQAGSGTIRAMVVFLGCGIAAVTMLLTTFACYLGEALRFILFSGGCALAPLFIAALGIDALRSQATRYICGLVAVACWPIGWALANIVTIAILRGVTGWIENTTVAALELPAGTLVIPPLATSAPFVAWAMLLVFVAVTVVCCAWAMGVLVLIPYALMKSFAAGITAISTWMPGGAASDGKVARSGGRAAPPARAVQSEAVHPATIAKSHVGSAVEPGRRVSTLSRADHFVVAADTGTGGGSGPPGGVSSRNARTASWLVRPSVLGKP